MVDFEMLGIILISVFLTVFVIVAVVMTIKIMANWRKNPPYHKISETGDISVYLFEQSEYHEYLFLNTVNGLKYVRSQEKKTRDIILITLFTIIFAIKTIPVFRKGGFGFSTFLLILLFYIFYIAMIFSADYIYLRTAKKYIKNIGFDNN